MTESGCLNKRNNIKETRNSTYNATMKTYWFIFNKSELLLEKCSDGTYTVPFSEKSPVEPDGTHTVHTITGTNGNDIRTFYTDKTIPEDDIYIMCDLRKSYKLISSDLYLEAGKCEEILYWDSTTQYCGVCGSPMKMHTSISKICEKCHREVWPQLSTAIICLIHRGDNILLVRAHNFRGNFYGLVAGFVETGETLEQAVEREIKEETGLKVKNIEYFGSQPWPYPINLMVGFYAEYDEGEIRIQQTELKTAAWFDIHNLPTIPEKLSIARRLIDNWLKRKGLDC